MAYNDWDGKDLNGDIKKEEEKGEGEGRRGGNGREKFENHRFYCENFFICLSVFQSD
jgi:hypothetical protein